MTYIGHTALMNAADPEGVRIIKRYANRKLYDTGSGELTSQRRIEALVHQGVEIRVVDHETDADLTSEVLVGVLGNALAERPAEDDVALLTWLIRTPGDLIEAMRGDERRTKELRAMGERVRLLSATIDSLLHQMDPPAPAPTEPCATRAAKRPAKGAT